MSSTTAQATQPNTSAAQAHALLRRARLGIAIAGIHSNEELLHFWQGVASAADDFSSGATKLMAERDARALSNDEQTGLQAAAAALPIRMKHLTMAQVQQILTAQGIEVATDLVPDLKVEAAQAFKNDVVAPLADPQNEHLRARVDVGHGPSLHVAPPSFGIPAMVEQVQGGAA